MVSPVVRMAIVCWKKPRGAAWITKASRSPPQKLEWTTSGRAASRAESSVEYSPAYSLGKCSPATCTSGLSLRTESRKTAQESCPQA
jgi:hypothetical protein